MVHNKSRKWLDVFCPEDSCLTEEERMVLETPAHDTEHSHRSWLDVFCPEGSCEITSATQLP